MGFRAVAGSQFNQCVENACVVGRHAIYWEVGGHHAPLRASPSLSGYAVVNKREPEPQKRLAFRLGNKSVRISQSVHPKGPSVIVDQVMPVLTDRDEVAEFCPPSLGHEVHVMDLKLAPGFSANGARVI